MSKWKRSVKTDLTTYHVAEFAPPASIGGKEAAMWDRTGYRKDVAAIPKPVFRI